MIDPTATVFPEYGYYEAAAPRSGRWYSEVRPVHLEKFPKCACCGGSANLNVHHVRPFHLYPELELAASNLITLCEGGSINCHFLIGHGGKSWKNYVPEDSLRAAIKLVQGGVDVLRSLIQTEER